MIAASPETTRSRIVSAAAHLSPSLDDRHQTESSRYFLPTENPEGPLIKGGLGGFQDAAILLEPVFKTATFRWLMILQPL